MARRTVFRVPLTARLNHIGRGGRRRRIQRSRRELLRRWQLRLAVQAEYQQPRVIRRVIAAHLGTANTDGDILLSVKLIADRAGKHASLRRHAPELLASARVVRTKFLSAAAAL